VVGEGVSEGVGVGTVVGVAEGGVVALAGVAVEVLQALNSNSNARRKGRGRTFRMEEIISGWLLGARVWLAQPWPLC